MPTLAKFYGIVLKMYFQQKEHNPPHLHAIYGDCSGVITISPIEMLEGDLPQKALEMIKEWVVKYQKELLEIWETQNFIKLPPLE
ncbi:MAG: DUF4160 domain-containing protein [Holosporales bacterium]|jgi:hypothetical protein|nr:DUF4160 domain-containing protein [Holosporales bacterium]